MDEKTEKKAKPKQTGMDLQLDVIKKISHQLKRLKDAGMAGAAPAVIAFVQDWAQRQTLTTITIQNNGQLPLAAKDEDAFG